MALKLALFFLGWLASGPYVRCALGQTAADTTPAQPDRFRSTATATAVFGVQAYSNAALVPTPGSAFVTPTVAPSALDASALDGSTRFPSFPSSPRPEIARPLADLGIASQVSTLGAGLALALPVRRQVDLRGGFHLFDYNRGFSTDGVHYAGTLHLRSMELLADVHPWRTSFHISPGVLLFNGNRVRANATVPAGNTFTLNDGSYTSDPADPITGSGSLKVSSTAPMVLLGWGSVLPRARRWSIPVEFGSVLEGAPMTTLSLQGSVCDTLIRICRSVASDPGFQTNLLTEQAKFRKDVQPYKYYPVLSLGVAYRFSLRRTSY